VQRSWCRGTELVQTQNGLTRSLITPTDYNTGFKYVTKDTVNAYLQNKDTWEGSSPSPVVFTRPKSISF
jgi:hypothetical protein